MSDIYIQRHAEKAVSRLSQMFGAVLVAGPRQVGKTTMLKEMTSDIGYVTLDDQLIRAGAVTESGTFFKDNPPPVFIDEIQKAPALFEQIKMILDRDGKKAQFFMCGSQQFKMMKGVSESLAGRLGLVTLLGFSLRETHGLTFDEPFLPTENILPGVKISLRILLTMRYGKLFIVEVCRSLVLKMILTGRCFMAHMSGLILSVM